MTLQLFIKENLIEVVEIDVTDCHTFRAREKMILDYSNYLKSKWKTDLIITNSWEIILTTSSFMNSAHYEELE